MTLTDDSRKLTTASATTWGALTIPSLDELCHTLGLSSRGSLQKHIQAMIETGLVEPMDGKQRGQHCHPGSFSGCRCALLRG